MRRIQKQLQKNDLISYDIHIVKIDLPGYTQAGFFMPIKAKA